MCAVNSKGENARAATRSRRCPTVKWPLQCWWSAVGCGWTCNAVPDERSTLETEVSCPQGEKATLKKEPLAAAATPRAEPACTAPFDPSRGLEDQV